MKKLFLKQSGSLLSLTYRLSIICILFVTFAFMTSSCKNKKDNELTPEEIEELLSANQVGFDTDVSSNITSQSYFIDWENKFLPLLKNKDSSNFEVHTENNNLLEVKKGENSYKLYLLSPENTNPDSILQFFYLSQKIVKNKVLLCVLNNNDRLSFNTFQRREMRALKAIAKKNGITTFSSLQEVANYIKNNTTSNS
ncbi:MAG: hypothetical protein ACEPOW_01555 [Bacteroidales bacterium]